MSERTSICATCRNWKPGPTRGMAGECRAAPPMVLVFSDKPETHFPAANRDDWCGAYHSHPRCTGQYQTPGGVAPCGRAPGHTGQCGPAAVEE